MLSPPFDVLPVVPRGVRPLISTPNQWLPSDHPTPLEGRIAIVTNAGWVAVDAGSVRHAIV
jgi:hypothetical protein